MTSLRIAAALLVAVVVQQAAPGSSSKLTPDQENILETARTYALQYTAKLPNFICTQVTKRDSSRANTNYRSVESGIGGAFYGESDEVVEKLTYFNQKEDYQVISINKRKVEGKQHSDLGGANSAGEFGSALLAIFDPITRTTFSGHRTGELRGRHVHIFAFQVPKESGIPVAVKSLGVETLIAYHGLVFFDAASNEVLRVTTEFDFPSGFPIQKAYRLVDYDSVTIAGRRYNLPAHAEVNMQSASESFVNKIDFKDYREFAVKSTIRFGVLDESAASKSSPSNKDVASAPPAEVAPGAQASGNAETTEPAPHALVAAEETHTAVPAPLAQPPAAISVPQTPQRAEPAPAGRSGVANPTSAPPPTDTKVEPRPNVDAAPRLQISTDLVLIPVVVRDESGRVRTNLSKEDFQIFDKGKRQEIASFTVETREGQSTALNTESAPSSAAQKPSAASPLPPNYIVYLVDDIHLKFEDLVPVREAARQSVEALPATDLAAIVTTSGLVQSPMTTDRAKFKDALQKLRAEPLGGTSEKICPDIDAYMANLILNQSSANRSLINAVMREANACLHLVNDPSNGQFAANLVQQAARSAQKTGELQIHQSVAQLRDVVRWVGKAPGRRSILLLSAGFVLDNSAQMDGADIVDEAIRDEVTISALDARGVYGENPAGAIEDKSADPNFRRMKSSILNAEATEAAGVMMEMANGTGGTFIHNTNDLNAGLKALATPPECIYVIGFKPEKLKLDGSTHPLVVKLNSKEKLDVKARRSYIAAKR